MINKSEEKKYYQKLGIVPTSIDNIKNIIKTNIKNTLNSWATGNNIEKQTFKIIGEAGIGKTQISLQLAEELTKESGIKFDSIIIKAPVLSRDDLLCPFPIIDNGKSRFKMLYSDFVPLEEDSYGLFIIDELSRGDSSFQQLCWQIQNEQKVHTHPLPRGWFVICIDNPDDQEYSLNIVEDAAGLRRVLHLYSEVNAQAFLNYAIESNFHQLVIEFIQIHPDYLYDFDSQKIGMIYANPATWERVSNILWGFENWCQESFDGQKSKNPIIDNLDQLTTLFGGLLNQNMTRLFLSYIKDKKDINPRDIFWSYQKVRKDILKFVENEENIKMSQLIESFITFLVTSKPDYEFKQLENISLFLGDIPADIGVLFISKIASYDIKSPEYSYITGINMKLIEKFPFFRTKFYETMVNTSRKVHSK